MATKSKYELRRYMDVPALLDLLLNKRLTLLNPKSWDDRNDSHFLEIYRQRAQLKSVRAACFSSKAETYHHWRIFASGPSGVCVVFRRDELIAFVTKHPGLCGDVVDYKTNIALKEMKSLDDMRLPFLKREPYRDEGEYRIIYSDKLFECDDAHNVDMPLSLIKRVVLSPWMPRSLSLSVKSIIHGLDECSQLQVTRSTLVDTEMWKDALAAYTAKPWTGQ